MFSCEGWVLLLRVNGATLQTSKILSRNQLMYQWLEDDFSQHTGLVIERISFLLSNNGHNVIIGSFLLDKTKILTTVHFRNTFISVVVVFSSQKLYSVVFHVETLENFNHFICSKGDRVVLQLNIGSYSHFLGRPQKIETTPITRTYTWLSKIENHHRNKYYMRHYVNDLASTRKQTVEALPYLEDCDFFSNSNRILPIETRKDDTLTWTLYNLYQILPFKISGAGRQWMTSEITLDACVEHDKQITKVTVTVLNWKESLRY